MKWEAAVALAIRDTRGLDGSAELTDIYRGVQKYRQLGVEDMKPLQHGQDSQEPAFQPKVRGILNRFEKKGVFIRRCSRARYRLDDRGERMLEFWQKDENIPIYLSDLLGADPAGRARAKEKLEELGVLEKKFSPAASAAGSHGPKPVA